MKSTKILLTLLLLAFSFTAFAQSGGDFRREAKEKLKLTAEQEKSMKEIRIKTSKDMIDIRSELQKKRIDLRNVMDTDNPDRAQVERLSREIGDLQLKQKMLLFDADAKVRNILTPEQRKVWKDIKAEGKEKIKERIMKRGRMKGKSGDRELDD